jgi:hypothetical protein
VVAALAFLLAIPDRFVEPLFAPVYPGPQGVGNRRGPATDI